MGGTGMLFVVSFSIFSLAIIFMIMLLMPNKVTKEKLEKILGKEIVEKLKDVQDDEEKMKEIIRSLKTSKKIKLKTLFESQDVRDVIKGFKEHFKD